MAPTIFRIILFAVVAYALLRGGRDERRVGLLCVAGTFLTELALSPLNQRFEGLETQVLVIDLALFSGFLWIALRSERFWPLWVTGLQLTTLLGHALKTIEGDLFARAYGAALTFWAYPILLILAVGTWRGARRRALERSEAAAA